MSNNRVWTGPVTAGGGGSSRGELNTCQGLREAHNRWGKRRPEGLALREQVRGREGVGRGLHCGRSHWKYLGLWVAVQRMKKSLGSTLMPSAGKWARTG